MGSELVSVVVPAYAHQHYVIDCLQSLHAQSHDRLELVFIDDCSPDRTFEYAQSLLATPFGRRFENVILHRNDRNTGAHDSLNMGLSLATGRYLAIVNSDDLFRERRIEKLVDALASKDAHLAFSAVEPFLTDEHQADGESEPESRIPVELQLMALRQHLDIARDVTVGFALLRRNVAISTGNFVMTAELARRIGGFQPLKYCHDWDFILQSLLHCEPVFVPETLYDYRVHPHNSFRDYQHLAEIETEVVLRRFFAAVASSRQPSPRCPGPVTWPGYFEAFITAAGYRDFWLAETGGARAGCRTRESVREASTVPASSILRDIGDRIDAHSL